MKTIKKKDGRGGARPNGGRKKLPKSEKKIPITVFVEGGVVQGFGGERVVKSMFLNALGLT